jgi:hypothetical protein
MPQQHVAAFAGTDFDDPGGLQLADHFRPVTQVQEADSGYARRIGSFLTR